jgi:hypothetical protein
LIDRRPARRVPSRAGAAISGAGTVPAAGTVDVLDRALDRLARLALLSA